MNIKKHKNLTVKGCKFTDLPEWFQEAETNDATIKNIRIYLFGKVEFGKMEIGSLDFGKTEFGKKEYRSAEFGNWEFGKMEIGSAKIWSLDFGKMELGKEEFSKVTNQNQFRMKIGSKEVGRPIMRVTTDGVAHYKERFKRGQAIDLPNIVEESDGKLMSDDIGVLSVELDGGVLVIQMDDYMTDYIYFETKYGYEASPINRYNF